MNKLKLILIFLLFAVITMNAQTSEFRRNFSTTSGAPLSGYTNYIFLVPQANTYPTGALALTEDGTRDGVYYRANVPDGEYKIYIDVDKAGAGTPSLYIENYWIGEKRLSTIADHFDALDSYRLKGTGIKDGAITEQKIENSAVVEGKIGNSAVSENKISDGAVTNDKLGANSVTTDKIVTDGVESSDIKDANITVPKLSQTVIDLINISGGGTITNNPDDISLETKVDSTIGIKDSWVASEITTPIYNLSDTLTKKLGTTWITPQMFGAIGDGVTEDSSAFQNALQYLFNSGGGTLYIPEGVYLISSQLIFPKSGDGSTTYLNKSIKIIGDGNFNNSSAGNSDDPTYGSVIKLNYSGSANYLAITYGSGTLTLEGLTFWTEVANKDLLRVIATTVYINKCSFIGSDAGVLATNDAIILGGTYSNESFSQPAVTDSSGFQGYGTVISSNYFYKIRRGVFLQHYANATQIINNTWWSTCGSNIDSVGAIESLGSELGYSVGNYISGNLFEMQNYDYGMKFRYGIFNTIVGNSFYDYGAGVIATYRFQNNSYSNYVTSAMHDQTGATEVFSEDVSCLNKNMLFNSNAAGYSTIPLNHNLRLVGNMRITGNDPGLYWADGTNTYDQIIQPYYGANANPFFQLQLRDSLGLTPMALLELRSYGGGYITMGSNDATTLVIQSATGSNLRLNGGGTTGTNWIGAANKIYESNGSLNLTTGYQSFGNGTNPGAGGNQVRIYGEDVSGTTRLKIVDEGNRAFTVYQVTGSVTFSSSGTAAVSFSTNESDTTYKVFVTGNIGETFWVTSKATTGFTINSSNASSTAVVDFVVMR